MLKDIEVKKIAPAQLPNLLWFTLKHKYHTEQWDFVVAFDGRNQIMYVDKKIPDDDVQKFVEAASWPEGNINDPDCPIAGTVNYIYETYGWNVWSIILDNHRQRYEKIETEKAQKRAAELLPLIRGEIDAVIDGDAPDPFDDRLVSCLSDAGRKEDRERNMSGCVTGTDMKYVFYLGYLMGSGKIEKEGLSMDLIEERRKIIKGIEITTHTCDIVSANMLEVEAGSNGYMGGDTGHGSRAYFRIEDTSSTDMEVRTFMSPYGNSGFEVFLGGDCELETMIRALKFITKVLEDSTKEVRD